MLNATAIIRPLTEGEDRVAIDFDELEAACDQLIPAGLTTVFNGGAPKYVPNAIAMAKPGTLGLTDIFVVINAPKNFMNNDERNLSENIIRSGLEYLKLVDDRKIVINVQIVLANETGRKIEFTNDPERMSLPVAIVRAGQLIKQMRADKDFLKQPKRVA